MADRDNLERWGRSMIYAKSKWRLIFMCFYNFYRIPHFWIGEGVSNQKKFKTYRKLTEALRRANIQNQGTTATVLLECFVCNDGHLRAGLVVERGLCEERKFTVWRKQLIDGDWLVYADGDYARHKPGAKLLKYINEEKLSRSEMATIDDFAKVDLKVEALTERVLTLETSVKTLIEKYDPPVTDEKLIAYIPPRSSRKKRAASETLPPKTTH